MIIKTFYLISISWFFAVGSAVAEDWPTYMHDANRSGVTSESLGHNLVKAWVFPKILPPQEAWQDEAKKDDSVSTGSQRPFKERTVFDRANHLAIVNGMVYIASATEHTVQCLDAVTGEVKWIFFAGGPVRMAPTVVDGKVYVGADNGTVYCLNAVTGDELWAYTAAGSKNYLVPNNGRAVSPWAVRSGVLVDGGLAYFASGIFPSEGVYLTALSAETGVKQWQTEHVNQGTMQGYMLMSPTRIFVPNGRGNPYYYSRSNGAKLGQYSDREASGTFALLVGNSLYFGRAGRTQGELAEGNATGGDIIAKIADGNAIVVDNDINYLLYDTKIEAKKRSDGSLLWSKNVTFPHTMIVTGNTVYAGGDDRVAGFDRTTGNQVWSAPVTGKALGLAVSAGKLFVSTDRGLLYAFTPRPDGKQSQFKVR